MSTWEGFSDIEIRKAKKSHNSKKTVKHEPQIQEATFSGNTKRSSDVSSSVDETKLPVTTDAVTDGNCSDVTNTENEILLSDSPSINLEELHHQQEMMEEENKRKKELLEKTLKERYEQTIQENDTLHKVKEELEKLDLLVTRDISILRNKIEEANRIYTSSRKRFEVAEKEYLSAKLALHEATENKELLSEHLCAIIQHNELRKSKKLNELMTTLQLVKDKDVASGSTSPQYMKTPTPDLFKWQSPKPAVTSKPPPPPAFPLGSSMIAVHRMD